MPTRLPLWKKISRFCVDFLFPPSCPLCRGAVSDQDALCGGCFATLEHIGDPQCEKCGDPFEYALPGAQICVLCMTKKNVALDAATAPLAYNATAKRLVFRLKFCDGVYLCAMMAKWMAMAGRDFLSLCDVVVPVPSCTKRLRQRKYNQTALLARRLAALSGKEALCLTLKKIKTTRAQTGLSAKSRERNLAGAFAVPLDLRKNIAGKHVLLVDDVYTTGATLEACAKALKKAGAASVRGLTLCKTLKK